jgi:hypothetical protein
VAISALAGTYEVVVTTELLEECLWTHCALLVSVCLVVLVVLVHKGLFSWVRCGFWAWASFLLTFVLNPMVTLARGDFSLYRAGLADVPAPEATMLSVTALVALSVLCFFWAYLRNTPYTTPDSTRTTIPNGMGRVCAIVCVLCCAVGMLAMYKYRLGSYEHMEVVNGRFVQGNGYQFDGYLISVYPLLLFVLNPRSRWLGLALVTLTCVLKATDIYDRSTAVALVVGVSIVFTLDRNHRWPPLLPLAACVIALFFFVGRGHVSVREATKSSDWVQHVSTDPAVMILAGHDTDMLASLYQDVSSTEKYGYTYGLTFLERAVFGFLPRTYFPWKDTLFLDVGGMRKHYYANEVANLKGAKSFVIGDLYEFWGFLGVILGMALIGYLCRKLDGLLTPQTPLIYRAAGVTIMSRLWISLPSTVAWIYSTLSLTLFAFLVVWYWHRLLCAWASPPSGAPPSVVLPERSPLGIHSP